MADRGDWELLSDGVEAWNARRQDHSSWRPNLARQDMTDTELSGIDLSGANLREATLGGYVQGEAIAEAALLRGADLKGADLRLAHLAQVDLADAQLDDADLRSVFLRAGEGPHRRRVSEKARWWPTDLSETLNLTQSQIDRARGDRMTLLPEGLERPANWPDVPDDPAPPVDAPSAGGAVGRVRAVAARLEADREVVILTGAELLVRIAAFREEVRKSNRLAGEDPDFRDGLLAFLDRLAADLEGLLEATPAPGEVVTDEAAEATASWFKRFSATLRAEGATYLDPERLGKAAAPISVILGCGAVGALFGPLGFGAGLMAGRFLTGELKSSAVADKVGKALTDDTPPPEGG